jgi:hypothetical protein
MEKIREYKLQNYQNSYGFGDSAISVLTGGIKDTSSRVKPGEITYAKITFFNNAGFDWKLKKNAIEFETEKDFEEYEFMNDYEVNTTFSAVVPNNYTKTITIKYVDETNNEVVFDLKKADNYSKTIKIKNGHYYHPEIISDGLICKDVPSNINVRGLTFKLNFEFESKNDIAE